MDTIVLHRAGNTIDVLEQEGDERNLIFVRQQRVGFTELLDVVGAIVWRECDACEHDFYSSLEQRRNDLVEVLSRD